MFISVKIDHIKKALRDDQAFLEMLFSPNGRLIAQLLCTFQEKGNVGSGWVAGATEMVADPKTSMTAALATSLVNELLGSINEIDASGETRHFPVLIQHNINLVQSMVGH
jgi:hypothetical protein